MKILLGVFITLMVILVASLIFIYSGWYNVSAMEPEVGIIEWALKTTKNNSIESRTKNIFVPDLNDSIMINEGFEHYNEMCVSCHGAPGKEETELSKGLNPSAPFLVEHAKEIDPAELFWVTKYGIKMTGMPAWGKTHSDEQIWNIVAFMKKLPEISAEEYERMRNKSAIMDESQKQQGKSDEHPHSQNIGSHNH